jgi:MoaA/NifB/PqqE/SkfB family radical SAM enzyme
VIWPAVTAGHLPWRSLPGQLSHAEGLALIDQMAAFGRPRPILVLTGGDVLKHDRLFEVIAHARSQDIAVSVSPSVTPLLTPPVLERLARAGVVAVSFSLDGASPETNDTLRGVLGAWVRSIELMRHAVNVGLKVQINTAVMSSNILELPALFEVIAKVPVDIWGVFFIIHTGSGRAVAEATPVENEAVCHFLYQAGGYGITIRTVEGPFFRRLVQQYEAGTAVPPCATGVRLIADLHRRLGPPAQRFRVRSMRCLRCPGGRRRFQGPSLGPHGRRPGIGPGLRAGRGLISLIGCWWRASAIKTRWIGDSPRVKLRKIKQCRTRGGTSHECAGYAICPKRSG